MTYRSLIEADDSSLVVIDAQPVFTKRLPEGAGRSLVSRICWLIEVANWLQVPVVVTAEDVTELGSVERQVQQVLPADTVVYDKMVFGLSADPDILASVEKTGRKTVVLTGLETDVCVAHSAIGVADHGYEVVVIADATGSAGTGHEFGLERVRGAGVLVTSLKGLFYEWMRTVECTKRFHAEWNGMTPSSLNWPGYWVDS